MQLQDANTPKLFIRVDIHKLTWSVSIQTDLFFHRTFSLPSEPEVLYQYVMSHFPDHEVSMAYEAGCCGFLAAVIIAECGDLRRFNNEKQFASFIGLVPGIYSSGQSEKSLGLTQRGRHQLRSYLVEAAWIAVRKDPEM